MLKNNYSVSGIFSETNRKRKVDIYAFTEAEAIENAKQQGFIEPLETSLLPHSQPTERQIEYLKALGGQVPDKATSEDVSVLIEKMQDKDNEASEDLKEFVRNRGISFSEYIGKKLLYDIVFGFNSSDDDFWRGYSNGILNQREKIAFFAFCIYRWLSDDRRGNLDTHPDKEIFYEYADTVINDNKVVSSINKYDGRKLRVFGNPIGPSGNNFDGGSENTIAYHSASSYISYKFKIEPKRKQYIDNNSKEKYLTSDQRKIINESRAKYEKDNAEKLKNIQEKMDNFGNKAMGAGCLIIILIGICMFLFSWIKC